MTQQSAYVFLTTCAGFADAQVIKSFLVSRGLHPRVRDEQTRSVAPYLEQTLGSLTIEIPEHEFVTASLALEESEKPRLVEESPEVVTALQKSQALAKKALWNSILGCIILPVVCNFYSMILGFRVLASEMPLSSLSRRRLLLSFVFNSFGFYFWLTYGFNHFFKLP